MADDSYVEPHAPAMQTKEERDRRIAELSRERGGEWVFAMNEGAAAYRQLVLALGSVEKADAAFRRRFGESFDRAVGERVP